MVVVIKPWIWDDPVFYHFKEYSYYRHHQFLPSY